MTRSIRTEAEGALLAAVPGATLAAAAALADRLAALRGGVLTPGPGVILFLAAAVAAGPTPSAAQEQVIELAADCSGGLTDLYGPCLETALAVQAAQGVVGLAASGGTSLAGSASTLGKRFDGRPRLAFTVRGGFVDGPMPDALAPATGPAGEGGAFAPSVQATVAAGLLRGFSTAPTMGGILSLDLLGTFSWVDLPGDRGFEDSATGFGLGARVGVFRESFTLPGVTLSATRRWMGEIRLTEGGEEGTHADVDVTVTSLRGTVGKALATVDVLAGIGWDRYAGDVEVAVRPEGAAGPEGTAAAEGFTSDRVMLFAGAGYTFLVYQLSGEVGWARGFDEVDDREDGYDPSSGSPFLRVGFRLTY